MSASKEILKEEAWIPTVCGMCYGGCAMKARRLNGTVVELDGFDGSSQGNGKLCSKGVAGLQNLYDPNRINYPMKRTNPKKGIGVEAQWKRISWDGAMDTLTKELGKILQDDPRKLLVQATAIHAVTAAWSIFALLMPTFGATNHRVGGGGVQPAFQKLKDHVKKFTCQWASEVSSVSAKTIQRIATEFAEAVVGHDILLSRLLGYNPEGI